MTGVYLAGRRAAGPHLARRSRWPRCTTGERAWHLRPGRACADGVRAVRAGRGPGRAAAPRACVGLADLRHRDRPGRQDRHRAGHLRRPAVAPPGPRRPRPDHRPRHRPLTDRRGPDRDRRHHPRGRPPLAAGPGRPVPGDGPASGHHRLVRVREDEPDDPHLGRLVRRRPHRATADQGRARPLLVVLDCKGGPDARVKAARTRRLLHAAGAGRVAVWPDEASVSLWSLPPRDLAVTLVPAARHRRPGRPPTTPTSPRPSLILAVTAPPRPARQRRRSSWTGSTRPGWTPPTPATRPRWPPSAPPAAHLPDIALRYRTLLDRLGPGFDGTGNLADADAWYFILEGTREQSVAEAQALAITELLAHAATSLDTEPRAILLACDDYSAVSGQVPLWQLYERGRSLGIGVQVSAQSWQGLGATDDERYRIAATADGGIWLMRTPYPEPISQLAGTRRVIETATKVIGGMWGDEGSSRVQHAWTADPGIARRLDTGQAAYIHAGGCTWVQIARPRPSPLPLSPPPARLPSAVVIPPAAPEERTRPWPPAARRRWTTCSGRRPVHDRPGPVRRPRACQPAPT